MAVAAAVLALSGYAGGPILVVFSALAMFALWANWHDTALRDVGIAVVLSFTLSNACFFGGIDIRYRPGIYTVIEMAVAVATYVAFIMSGQRLLFGVIIAALLSIAANISFAHSVGNSIPALNQLHLWELLTNLCFAAECIFAGAAGVAHGAQRGRFRNWLDRGRVAPYADVVEPSGTPEP